MPSKSHIYHTQLPMSSGVLGCKRFPTTHSVGPRGQWAGDSKQGALAVPISLLGPSRSPPGQGGFSFQITVRKGNGTGPLLEGT